ncbi:MAG: hypothetical protein AAGD07_10440 [Planctomycetota bacterium]
MQHALPNEYHRDLDRAYLEGDLDAAIQSLTKAFEKRTEDTVPALSPSGDADESKVVKDWRDLLGPGGPEGETAEDFLKPIYDRRDASGPRTLF